jgi:hypothetical protein
VASWNVEERQNAAHEQGHLRLPLDCDRSQFILMKTSKGWSVYWSVLWSSLAFAHAGLAFAGGLSSRAQGRDLTNQAVPTVTITWGGERAADSLDREPLGVGAWSRPASDGQGHRLRCRMWLYRGNLYTNWSFSYPQQILEAVPVYLEIQDLAANNTDATEVYFDLASLHYQLRDAKRKPVPEPGGGGSGGVPKGFWAKVPPGGILRFYANMGMVVSSSRQGPELRPDDLNLAFELTQPSWFIHAGDTNAYVLSATLAFPSTNSAAAGANAWQGNLVFPAVRLVNSPKPLGIKK